MSRLVDTPRTAPLVEPMTGLTPWEACVRLADCKHLLFLDSAQPSRLGRYSFVCADPSSILFSRACAGSDPVPILAQELARFSLETIAELPPFQGGAAGLF